MSAKRAANLNLSQPLLRRSFLQLPQGMATRHSAASSGRFWRPHSLHRHACQERG